MGMCCADLLKPEMVGADLPKIGLTLCRIGTYTVVYSCTIYLWASKLRHTCVSCSCCISLVPSKLLSRSPTWSGNMVSFGNSYLFLVTAAEWVRKWVCNGRMWSPTLPLTYSFKLVTFCSRPILIHFILCCFVLSYLVFIYSSQGIFARMISREFSNSRIMRY